MVTDWPLLAALAFVVVNRALLELEFLIRQIVGTVDWQIWCSGGSAAADVQIWLLPEVAVAVLPSSYLPAEISRFGVQSLLGMDLDSLGGFRNRRVWKDWLATEMAPF